MALPTLRDLSESGAKLDVLAITPLIEKFGFIIVADGTVTPAEVMWRKGDFVGIHFCGETKKVALRSICQAKTSVCDTASYFDAAYVQLAGKD